MEKARILISAEAIYRRVEQVAALLDQRYAGEELVLVAIMKGAICVAADLLRALKTPTRLEYVRACSYGHRGTERGELILEGYDRLDIEGRHVLLVDDIFDSGKTLTAVLAQLKRKGPRSLNTLVLLSKQVPREVDYEPDYALFSVENRFVVGWGLDYKELYRGLPGIYTMDQL